LSLAGLGPHAQATVSFDLYVIRTWDGHGPQFGPDIWDVSVPGGPTLLHTTFANPLTPGREQAYPDEYPGGHHLPNTGANEVDTLGYQLGGIPMDAVYHLSFSFPHTASTLALDFSDQLTEMIDDESWGIDNIDVYAGDQPAATSCPTTSSVVKDGSFEWPLASPGSFDTYVAGTTFGNWTVAFGTVDLVNTYWKAYNGVQSVDLSGIDTGAIEQDLATTPGQSYELSFWLAANPECGPTIKRLAVWWDGRQVAIRRGDDTGHSDADMGWTRHRLTLTATGATTRLEFRSLVPGGCGPAIDKVAMVPQPGP
jgi:choice-of-anchor C domain-containing protein